MTTSTPSPSQPTSILLLGAGELGTALLPHLSSLPAVYITVGVRSPHKHSHLKASNVDVAQVDLSAHSPTLIPTLASHSILITATGFAQSPGSVTKLAEEVLEAGRLRKERGQGRLWFFPWQWGVDYDVTLDGNGLMPLFGEQESVRRLLRSRAEENNVTWTVVSTGIFMSFLFEEFWGIVDRRSKDGHVVVRCLADWEHRVTVTDVADIGRVLKRILMKEVESEDRVVYVAGDTIAYGELADVVGRVTGCEVERETWSINCLEEEVKRDPENGIKKYRLVFAQNGVWWEKERTVNWKLGVQMVDVEMYARKLFHEQK
jgi:hypothetical protein